MKRIMEYLESTHQSVYTLTSRASSSDRYVNTEWFICKVCNGEGYVSDMESESPKTIHKPCGHCSGDGKIKLMITVERIK